MLDPRVCSWNHEQRCVDEGKLSMLSSVRAFLHEHLFGSGEADARLVSLQQAAAEEEHRVLAPRQPSCERYTYAALLGVFSRLDWRQAESITRSLRVCGPLVGSFIGLMGSDADSAAPHRLAALQGRQMRARFWCSSAPPLLHSMQEPGTDSVLAASGCAVEVTTTATEEDGLMLAPARTARQATQHSTESELSGRDKAVRSDVGRMAWVWLEYSVLRHGRLTAHVLPLEEVLDFQTTVVLATSHEEQEDMTAAINKFVHQLSLLQMLSATLWELHEGGHVAYQSYTWCCELAAPVEDIQDALDAAKTSLGWWKGLVAELRAKHASLNVCLLRHLFPLLRVLEAMPAGGESLAAECEASRTREEVQVQQELQVALFEITSVFAPGLHDGLAKATAALADAWRQTAVLSPPEPSCDPSPDGLAGLRLRRLAIALDAALCVVPRRVRRPATCKLTATSGAAANAVESDGSLHDEQGSCLPSGIHLACAENGVSALQLLVSACIHHGALPERESALLCSDGCTSFEEIGNFVRRWSFAGESRGATLYVLGGVDELQLELQHQVVSMLQHALASATDSRSAVVSPPPPLLLVLSTSETSPILLSLGYLRRSLRGALRPLPHRSIRRLLCEHGFTILSTMTGGGKSFAVRATAAAEGRRYLHVPVHSAAHTPLLARIRHGMAAGSSGTEQWLVHLDVSTGVQSRMDKWLFEISVLGVAVDPEEGRTTFLDAPRVRFAIELPGSRGDGSLHLPAMLPVRWVGPSAATFCASPHSLWEGLGDAEMADERVAQLRRVCGALAEVRSAVHNEGVEHSPGDLTKAAARAAELTAPECFHSLMTVLDDSRGRDPPPSLTCTWSFIFALDQQLQQLNVPASVVRVALQLDPDTDVPTYEGSLKAKLSIAMLVLMIKSARELAGRPVPPSERGALVLPHDALCAPNNERARGGLVEVVGRRFSDALRRFNGRWIRCPFVNDGKEVFQLAGEPTLYLYFRSTEGRWAVAEAIAPKAPHLATTTFDRMAGPWVRAGAWRQDARLSATEVAADGGWLRAGVLVEGCRSVDGHSPSALDNGTYLLQPPCYRYDETHAKYLLGPHKFATKPTQPSQIPIEFRHYVLTSSSQIDPETNLPTRRHLRFNSRHARWEISPLCDSFEDATCVSMGESLGGGWCQRLLTISEEGEFWPSRYADRKTPEDGSKDDSTKEDSTKEDSTGEENGGEDAEEGEDDEAFSVAPLPWAESSHQALLVGADRIQLLGLDGDRISEEMHPEMRSFLVTNHIEIGESLDRVRDNHAEVLSLITGVHRSRKLASTILDGEFHLTGDAILKILAIHSRLACGIPVVLSGECGCGKTFVIRYLAQWLRAHLLVLNVHGGTTSTDILGILDQAEALLSDDDRAAEEPLDDCERVPPEGTVDATVDEQAIKCGTRRVFVFFDELNACAHVAVMVEALASHSVGGRRLHPRLRILAAVNPYRQRAEREGAGSGGPGLTFNLGGEVQDDMSKLVYRVHPIPRTLQQFVFDFGYLKPEQEAQYVRAILARHLGGLRTKGHDVQKLDARCALALLLASQACVRDFELDPSAVSLRDAVRACELLDWFAIRIMKRDESKKAEAQKGARASAVKISPLAAALVLSLARLPAIEHRTYPATAPSEHALTLWMTLTRSAVTGVRIHVQAASRDRSQRLLGRTAGCAVGDTQWLSTHAQRWPLLRGMASSGGR